MASEMSAQYWVGPPDAPDRIRLGPPVASGAEGVLYRGHVAVDDTTLPIAVKMLQPAHLENLAGWTARWRKQVELLRPVRVPGMVGVRGGFVGPLPHLCGRADTATTSLYLLMDWVEGVALDRWATSVRDARPEQLLLTLVPVAAALDLLHSGAATRGVPVVHRDVKPANILICADGSTCLVDVGSVRGMSGDPGHSGLMGTVGYLAPEVRHGIVGPAADRYALGAVAYFLLTGRDPPVNAGVAELRRSLSEAPLLRDCAELVDHVVAMLHPDPLRRPTCLANWVAQLRRSSLVVLSGEVTLAPRAPARQPRGAGRQVVGDGSRAGRRRARRRWVITVALVAFGAGAVAAVDLPGRDRSVRDGAVTISAAPPSVMVPATKPAPPAVDLRDGGLPPWQGPDISSGSARDVVLTQWSKSGNRAGSRAILPADVALAVSTPRPAEFSGGWAVAWDDPAGPGQSANGARCATCGRGASGMAGTGAEVTADAVAKRWPTVIRWNDGSVLGYDWEAHDPSSGKMLAEIAVAGQRFAYNLWSHLGEDHLRYLISQLRFVAGAP